MLANKIPIWQPNFGLGSHLVTEKKYLNRAMEYQKIQTINIRKQ
jgi:hypothetical protein